MKQTAPQLRFEYNCAVSGLTTWGEAAYPGDQHVDIIGLDIYNKKQGKNPPPFQTTWQRKLLPALESHLQLARTHGKPVSYAEWANGSVDEPAYIANMAEWFNRLPASGPGKLTYQCYFNVAQPSYKLQNYPNTAAEYKRRFGH
jgi:beta-mannanase